jgi:hypothetical protein
MLAASCRPAPFRRLSAESVALIGAYRADAS